MTYLGASEDDLARDENEEHDLWRVHAVNETREQLRLVLRGTTVSQKAHFSHFSHLTYTAERGVRHRESFETNRKLDVTAPDHVLNLKLGEARREPQLLDNASVLARRLAAVLLALRTRHDHFARGENQGRRLWLANSHNDRSKALNKTQAE